MKQFIAICILSAILVSNTTLGELFRLHTLIHHFNEHKVWDNNDSLIDFIDSHYSSQINHPDDEHNDHENLPFKSNFSQVLPLITTLNSKIQFKPNTPQIIGDKVDFFINQDFHYINSYLENIWQPPRMA